MRLLSTILLLVACSPSSPNRSAKQNEVAQLSKQTTASASSQPDALPKADAAVATPTPTTPVGREIIAAVPSEAEYAELQDALRIHRLGRHSESRDALLALLKKDPSSASARYNLACAESLLGRFAESAAHMMSLLEEDLPHYRGRLAEDADLKGLRESAKMALIRERIAELDAAWQDAAKTSLPMIAWRGTLANDDAGSIRAGAWNAKTKRFVPLGRLVKNTIGAVVDLPNQRSLTLSRHKHTKASEGDYGNETPYDFRLEVHPLYGESPAVFTMLPAMATELEAFPVADGLHLRWLNDFGMAYLKHTLWKHVTSPDKRDAMETGQGWKLHIPEVPPRHFLYSQGSLAIVRDGGQSNFPGLPRYQWSSGQTKGFGLRQNVLSLPDKRDIRLSNGHGVGWANNLLVDDTGSYAWVISLQRDCKHLVDRIHLPSGKVSLVSRGDGLAAVRLHEGRLYLQLGEETRVLQELEMAWQDGDALPDHLGFIYPKCS